MKFSIHIHHRITRKSAGIEKYLQQIDKYAVLSEAQYKQVCSDLKRPEKREAAINKLVKHNTRFAVSCAKAFNFPGTDLADLIQAANIGLFEAAKRFNPDKGFRFISFAVVHIRKEMFDYVYKNQSLIQIPHDIAQLRQRLRNVNTVDELYDTEALAARFNCRPEHIERARDYRGILEIDKVYEDEDSNDRQIELVGDISADIPDDNHRELYIALNKLPERERLVITRYFGLDENPTEDLKAIAKNIGCTRENVRLIKERALRKVRNILS
jgi:RNA polymerase primary sigma factor